MCSSSAKYIMTEAKLKTGTAPINYIGVLLSLRFEMVATLDVA